VNTDDTQIAVDMALIADANNGNSPIVTYHLHMDDGQGGAFSTVGGEEPFSLVTSYSITDGIERGLTYQFRYRTRNSAGWSGYSDIGYITASRVPSAPASPTLDSASATTIVLDFTESEDNGGSPITSYELFMDTGSVGTAFVQVATYIDNAMTHTLTFAANAIVSGTTYGFKIRAVNDKGESSFSNEVRFAAASAPSQPN